MNGKDLPLGSSGEDGSWESLAEDLFGIDFGKPPEGEEILSPEELMLDELDGRPQDVEESGIGEEVSSADTSESHSAPESGEAETVEAVAEGSSSESLEAEQAGDEEAVDVAEESGEAQRDPYWDALNQWQWDDKGSAGETGRAQNKPPSKPGKDVDSSDSLKVSPTGATSRLQEVTSTPEDFRDEYIDDDAFGAGLLAEPIEPEPDSETSEATAAAAEATGVSKESLVAEEDKPPAKQRRRRRRRRRRPSKDDAQPDSQDTSKTAEVVDEEESVQKEIGEVSGEPSSLRRSTRRPQKSSPTTGESGFDQEDVERETEDRESESEEQSQKDDDDVSQETESSYHDIPTWQEAISYLLNASSGVSAGRNAETASQTKSETPRPSGRRGRRRR